jgi:hypothetical protein
MPSRDYRLCDTQHTVILYIQRLPQRSSELSVTGPVGTTVFKAYAAIYLDGEFTD